MIRSRSSRGSRRSVFVAADATTASHRGSSGVRLELRSQLAQGECLSAPIRGPALIRGRSIIRRIRLVIQGRGLKHRDERITSTGQEDAGGVHARLRKLVNQAM